MNLTGASEDATLKGFLDYVALLTELDRDDDDADMVTLMTVRVQGSWFPVFHDRHGSPLPHFRSADTLFGVEENVAWLRGDNGRGGSS